MPTPPTLHTATEGSRELDAEIARALGWVHEPSHRWCKWKLSGATEWRMGPDDWSTSLDAAVALVEEMLPGSYVGLQQNYTGKPPAVEPWTAEITASVGGCIFEQDASTAPLALLRALFAAREAG